jgi:hypothetical protein
MRLVGLVVLLGLTACGRLDFDIDDVEDGLVVRYPMDDDPQRGTLTAIPALYSAPCSPCPARMTGHQSGGYQFPGDLRVTLADASASWVSVEAPFTVSLWVLPQSPAPPDVEIPLSKPRNLTSTVNTLNLVIRQTGSVQYEIADPATTFFPAIGMAGAVRDGAWHHIALSWDGTTNALTIDGHQRFELVDTSRSDTQPIGLGGDVDEGVFRYGYVGGIDELRFYDRALTLEEIATLAR